MGVSGGRDSTWLLLTAVRLGLRPLAVHFDNGWNSEIAVTNIRNAIEKLGVELETVVADWEEFRDIQVAFLRASVPDVEVPTDLAIHSVLHRVAAKEGIRYILNGHSFRTEGVAPRGWTYFDGRYITAIQKRFGTRELRDFHNFGMLDVIRYTFVHRIHVVPILNYRPYNQAEITRLITEELGWTYYGGHHHESLYTKFIQSYLLPRKFRIDKRRTELSALIRSGQTTREEALAYLDSHEYEYDETLIPYVLAKLELTEAQWQEIWNTPPRSYLDYPSYYPRNQSVTRSFARILTALGIRWGILGRAEKNIGDCERLAGEEGLFDTLVEENLALLRQYQYEKILVTDPHAQNALQFVYPKFGARLPAEHYVTFLSERLEQLRPLLVKPVEATVTYHDNCCLARRCRCFDPPRKLLEAIPGVKLVEMERNREYSLCCGGGGGGMWLDGHIVEHGGRRLSDERVEEAARTGADTLAVSCPFELSRFEDSVKVVGLEGKLKVRDIIELLAESMELGEKERS